jgi:hypothetical protein
MAAALQGERDEIEDVVVVVGDDDHAGLALGHPTTIGFDYGSGHR